tara:strand:- start:292 stop:945 length:654 start_codon:yes stop_codon:yes gene_type:complete
MSQPRKAMKSMGFQGCCLRCDAEDIPGLKRCNNCIELHTKVKAILISDVDSELLQHMRELYSMLSKPELFDTDVIHGKELIYQQSLVSNVEFDGGFVYPEDIEELYIKQESTEQRRIMQDLVNKNPWKNEPPNNDIAKLIGDETWKDDELSKQEYSGKRTNPSKEIVPINKDERIGEDLKIGIKASIETEEDVKLKINQKEVWKNLIDEVDDILDDI